MEIPDEDVQEVFITSAGKFKEGSLKETIVSSRKDPLERKWKSEGICLFSAWVLKDTHFGVQARALSLGSV